MEVFHRQTRLDKFQTMLEATRHQATYLTLDHFLKAAFPALTAASTSSCVAIGTSQLDFLFEGLIPWRVFEVEVSLPSIMLENFSNWTLEIGLELFVLDSLVAEGAILMCRTRDLGVAPEERLSNLWINCDEF